VDELKVLVATTALRDMVRRGYLDICAIRKINEVIGNFPPREDLAMLEALHCIHFADMPPELQRGLPLLIQRVLGVEPLPFDYAQFSTSLRLKK
jgi:hypothetical protein